MYEINIYDDIDKNEGYTLKEIKSQLDLAGGEDVHVKIFSFGGSVFEGLAIYTELTNYSGFVTTEIIGISASISSIIFLAGRKRIINQIGFLMMHEAWTMTAGSAEQLEDDAKLLRQINAQLLSIYQKVTGLSEDVLKEKMSKDTYMGPDELLELGFVTEIKEGAKLVASIQNFTQKQLKPKELKMAMTKEEKAEFEALKAQNESLNSEIAGLKEAHEKALLDLQNKKQEEVQEAIKAEIKRQEDIRASLLHEDQKEFAETLVNSGKSLADAKLALFDHFKENKCVFQAKTVDPVAVLESQAPKASTHVESQEESVIDRWKALKDPKKRMEFFNKHKTEIEKELK